MAGIAGFALGIVGIGISFKLLDDELIAPETFLVALLLSVFTFAIGGMLFAVITQEHSSGELHGSGGTGGELGSAYDGGSVAATSSVTFSDCGSSSTGCH